MSAQTRRFQRPGRRLRLEWRLLVTARTPWLVAALFVLVSGAALLNGHDAVRRHRAAAADAVAAQVEQHAALKRDLARTERQRASEDIPPARLQPGLPSAGAAEVRVSTFRAALPPLSAALISAGPLSLVPQRYEVRGGGGARFWPFGRTVGTSILSGLTPEQPMDNPAAVVLGAFDPAFVTVYLYPLLILALMYDVVTGDRDAGTLALVAAQPITLGAWLATRVAIRGVPIVVFAVLVPAGATVLAMGDWSHDALTRVALWSLGVLVYCAIWTAWAVAVSLHARTSALSAVAAVSGWFVAIVLVPGAVGLAPQLLAPASTRVSFATEERAASLDVNARVDAAVAALNQLVRTRFGGSQAVAGDHPTFTERVDPPVEGELLRFPASPWTTPATVVQLSRGFAAARRTLVERRLAPVLAELDANERREAAFFAIARFLSPALLLQTIGDDVAGTGPARWTQFLGQLDGYVRERESFFTEKVLGRANVSSHDLDGSLVPFLYREEPLTSLVSRVAAPIAGLIAMAAVLGLVCALAVSPPAIVKPGHWRRRTAR